MVWVIAAHFLTGFETGIDQAIAVDPKGRVVGWG